MRLSWFPFLALPVLAGACGPRAGEFTSDDASESETTEITADASITATTTTTDPSTTSTRADTDTPDVEVTTDTVDDTGGVDLCPPLPESPVEVRVVANGLPNGSPIDIRWSCTVRSLEAIGTLDRPLSGVSLTLQCSDGFEPVPPVDLELLANPVLVLPLAVGEEVSLHYVFEGPFWMNTYLRLDSAVTAHVLTFVDGDSLEPEGFTFELPFDVESVSGLCRATPSDCANVERLGLSVQTSDGRPTLVGDNGHALVEERTRTEIWVPEATAVHDVQCTDTPDEWYRVLIASTGR